MSKNYVNRANDEEIIDIVHSILSNGIWNIETYNESILAKLMMLRNTPIKANNVSRDIEKDYADWLEN